MKMVRLITTCFFLLFICLNSFGQQNESVREYIEQYKDLAIAEMQRTGVPAAIKLAQGIHESSAGNSRLATKANNHFGIKCKADWQGPSISHDDDARGECFRKYISAIDSYKDHSNFLKKSSRYASLFELDATDYEGWANGLKKAGYATNPRYPQVIIKLIEDYNLQDYTMIALGKVEEEAEYIVNSPGGITNTPVIAVQKPITPEIIFEQPKYPEGVFKINETKVLFAKSGTSWLSIAQQHNIALAQLFDFNDIAESEVIEKDQLVYLMRKRRTGNNDFHTVQPGETLYDIAQREAIRMEALLEYNFLKYDMQPAVGEKLSLRGKSPVMPKLVLKENFSLTPSTRRTSSN